MIVFTSFISPAIDGDLIPHWAAHYHNFEFDRYKIFVHAGVEDTGRRDHAVADCIDILDRHGFEVDIVYGHFANAALQKKHLTAFKETLGPDDTLVVADSDEFHEIPAADYRRLIEEYEVIRGRLVDRWADHLVYALPDKPLKEQFPHEGLIFEAVAKKFRMQGGWPMTRQYNKVLAHRCKHEVILDGAHFVRDLPFSVKPLEFQKVYHYSWRGDIVKRFTSMTFMPPWWAIGICRMYHMDPEDMMPVYERLVNEIQVRI